MPFCLLPIMPCCSLAPVRSILSPASSSSVPPIEPIPPRRHHHASALAPLLSRLSIARLGAHRLPSACLLCHRPRRPSSLLVMSFPPTAPSPLSSELGGLRVGCGYGMFGCRRLAACLSDVVFHPRAIWVRRFHLVPVAISCGLASPHVLTAGACDGSVRGRFDCFPVGAF